MDTLKTIRDSWRSWVGYDANGPAPIESERARSESD